jgi:hypothetical protein
MISNGSATTSRRTVLTPHDAWRSPTIQQGDFFRFKGSQVAPTATMFLRTEPSLLDQFIAALSTLDASDEGRAVLQCVHLPDDA